MERTRYRVIARDGLSDDPNYARGVLDRIVPLEKTVLHEVN